MSGWPPGARQVSTTLSVATETTLTSPAIRSET